MESEAEAEVRLKRICWTKLWIAAMIDEVDFGVWFGADKAGSTNEQASDSDQWLCISILGGKTRF